MKIEIEKSKSKLKRLTPTLYVQYKALEDSKNNHDVINEFFHVLQEKHFYVKLEVRKWRDNLIVNGRKIVWRERKGSLIKLSDGVKVIVGDKLDSGGSIKYPMPSFKDDCAVIEFTCFGMPRINWCGDVNILDIEEIK